MAYKIILSTTATSRTAKVRPFLISLALLALTPACRTLSSVESERPAIVAGEMKKWQPVTVSFVGPQLSETGTPNPFTDFRLEVTFQHGDRKFVVPG